MKIDAIGFNVDTSVVTNRVKVDVDKIRKRAIATLSRRIKVQARRDIQTEYNLKASTINDRLSVSHKFFDVRLKARATGINLIAFGARQNSRGVSYAVKKGEARQTRVHAFIRSTRNGRGPFVWMRGASGSKYTSSSPSKDSFRGKHGYPIFQQFGPSVAQMLKHGDRPKRLADYASGVVAAEIARQTR